MATRYAAFGTKLMISDGADPENFTEIPGVEGVSGPGLTADTEDVTAHDSESAVEESVATIIRTGTVTFDIRWDPQDPTHQLLSTNLLARTRTNFQLIFPDEGNYQIDFEAQITSFSPDAPHAGALTTACELKLTAAPTMDAGA